MCSLSLRLRGNGAHARSNLSPVFWRTQSEPYPYPLPLPLPLTLTLTLTLTHEHRGGILEQLDAGVRFLELDVFAHNFDGVGYTVGHGYAGACDGALAPGASYTIAECRDFLLNLNGCDIDDGTGCEVTDRRSNLWGQPICRSRVRTDHALSGRSWEAEDRHGEQPILRRARGLASPNQLMVERAPDALTHHCRLGPHRNPSRQ